MTFKELVHKQCMELVNAKITLLRQTLNELKESASNETKSTAGDKHETALAMLQIEQENTSKQLENILSQKQLIRKINPAVKAEQIVNGTLVKTNNGYLFLSTALGKMRVEGTIVTALSPQSLLGNKLMGLKVSDTAAVNGITYVIEDIK
jgi:transcription elongation GreA/GreB family factor